MQSNSQQQVNSSSAVILVPSEPKKSNFYTNMRCIPSIRAFSSISIILGVTSMALQIAALCTNIPWYSFDPVGHGIWAGVFYIIAGSLGLASASKKTRALIITTVVFASLSIVAAIVAAVLSGLSADYGTCGYYYSYNCNAWISLEWTLMGFSIGAIFNSITLTVLASTALCKRRQSSAQSTAQYTGPAQGYAQPVQFMMSYPNQGWQNQGLPNQGFLQVYPTQNAPTMHYPLIAGVSSNTHQPLMVQHIAQQAYPNAPPSLAQQPELVLTHNEPLKQTSQQPNTNETSGQ